MNLGRDALVLDDTSRRRHIRAGREVRAVTTSS